MSRQKDDGRAFHTETAVAEAGVCPKYLACPTMCSNITQNKHNKTKKKLEMWANAQRDGRPAEYRWRPLFNAAKFSWRPLLDAVQ